MYRKITILTQQPRMNDRELNIDSISVRQSFMQAYWMLNKVNNDMVIKGDFD